MKRRKWVLLVLMGCVLALSACKKNSPPPPIPSIPTTSMSLKFSGHFFTSSSVVAIYNTTLNTIQIGAPFETNSFISLIVPNVSVGTFDLSGGNASLSFLTGNPTPDTFVSTAGSVTISEFSSTAIVGTFEFTGVDSANVSREISEGQFTTSYTVTK